MSYFLMLLGVMKQRTQSAQANWNKRTKPYKARLIFTFSVRTARKLRHCFNHRRGTDDNTATFSPSRTALRALALTHTSDSYDSQRQTEPASHAQPHGRCAVQHSFKRLHADRLLISGVADLWRGRYGQWRGFTGEFPVKITYSSWYRNLLSCRTDANSVWL